MNYILWKDYIKQSLYVPSIFFLKKRWIKKRFVSSQIAKQNWNSAVCSQEKRNCISQSEVDIWLKEILAHANSNFVFSFFFHSMGWFLDTKWVYMLTILANAGSIMDSTELTHRAIA